MKIPREIYAIATLSGTIIGVGLFALPYLTLQLNFWVMLAYFVVLGILAIFIHLFFGELALKTPDYKRLPGFARIYLGKKGEKIAYFSTIIGIFGALLAYMIVGGEFVTELLAPVLGGNLLIYTLLYFAIGAALMYFGIKAIAKVQFWGLILFFIILLAIFLRGLPFIESSHLLTEPDFSYLFLPYGIVLFSLWGVSLVPEAEELLIGRKHNFLKIIPISVIIPIIIYLFFIYLILGITGPDTTESALAGLRHTLGDGIVTLALLFGLITTFTSFIALGLTLKKVLWFDLKLSRNLAWALTCFVPLAVFLSGAQSFILVTSFVGGVMLGIDGILVLLMYRKIKPRHFLIFPLLLILMIGIIYQIMYSIR